jgi:hypothetical protein
MQHAPASWVIDPDDPRGPPQEIWDQMTPAERQRVVDSLPSKRDMVQTHAFDECCQPGVFPLPETGELITRMGDLETRIEHAERRTEVAERRADEAERALAEALAEIDRLKRKRP